MNVLWETRTPSDKGKFLIAVMFWRNWIWLTWNYVLFISVNLELMFLRTIYHRTMDSIRINSTTATTLRSNSSECDGFFDANCWTAAKDNMVCGVTISILFMLTVCFFYTMIRIYWNENPPESNNARPKNPLQLP